MKDMGNKAVSRSRKPSLFARVVALIEEARQKVATVANIAQVYTNYEIGRQIVEEEQGGKRRAEYGKKVVEELSIKLTARFGRGTASRATARRSRSWSPAASTSTRRTPRSTASRASLPFRAFTASGPARSIWTRCL